MASVVTSLIYDIWDGTLVHQDWKDAIMDSLYKNKGKDGDCGNYLGISILTIVGSCSRECFSIVS